MFSWLYEWLFPNMIQTPKPLEQTLPNYGLIQQDVFIRECVGIPLSKTYAEVCKTKQIYHNNKPLMRKH